MAIDILQTDDRLSSNLRLRDAVKAACADLGPDTGRYCVVGFGPNTVRLGFEHTDGRTDEIALCYLDEQTALVDQYTFHTEHPLMWQLEEHGWDIAVEEAR